MMRKPKVGERWRSTHAWRNTETVYTYTVEQVEVDQWFSALDVFRDGKQWTHERLSAAPAPTDPGSVCNGHVLDMYGNWHKAAGVVSWDEVNPD